jgi:hypothetical protein
MLMQVCVPNVLYSARQRCALHAFHAHQCKGPELAQGAGGSSRKVECGFLLAHPLRKVLKLNVRENEGLYPWTFWPGYFVFSRYVLDGQRAVFPPVRPGFNSQLQVALLLGLFSVLLATWAFAVYRAVGHMDVWDNDAQQW